MASITPVIVPAKVLKGGKHKIRISVAHNGTTRYIVTDIIIDSSKEFRNGSVIKRPDAAYLNTKIRGIVQNYQEIIDECFGIDGLNCVELTTLLKNKKTSRNCTLLSVFQEFISNSPAKDTSKHVYETAWSTITKHISPTMLVTHITHGTILGIEKYFREKGLRNTTINNYMSLLSSLVNYARKCGHVSFKTDPFAFYRKPSAEVRQAWLSVEEIKRIRDYPFKRKNHEFCRDLFMLSYYLGGINIADMIEINFNEQKANIRYVRKKTENKPKINPYVEFAIPEEAFPIIERVVGKDGRIKLNDYQRKSRLNGFFEYNMPRMSQILGIDRLIFYSARKSFSQHAYEIGIKTSVIDYILGHNIGKQGKSLYHYIYVSPEMATEAIRKVLDILK